MEVAVIGGGITGLTLAYRLAKEGRRVTLFEKDERLGGLAASIKLNGAKVEKYYHFICLGDQPYFDLLKELGLDDKLAWKETKMSYYAHGHLYGFSTPLDLMKFKPLGFFERWRAGINILYSSRINNWEPLDRIKAKDWLVKHIGINGYEQIWEPLMRMKFGDMASEISAAWIWGRAKRVAKSRVKGMARERLGYVEGGTETILQALEKAILESGGEILLNTEVTKVKVEEGGGFTLEAGGQARGFDQVVSTLPVPAFLKLAEALPADLEKKLSDVEYYAVACAFLRMKHPITDNFWLNAHDERISFAGIIEYTNLNPLPALKGSSIAYIPYYLEPTHEFYTMDAESHRRRLIEEIKHINPDFSEDWIEYFNVFKDIHAQPLCLVGHLDRIPPMKTQVKGLYLAEMSQIYPEDRGISNGIDLGNKVSAMMEDDV